MKLQISGITKSFAAQRVLYGVNIEATAGETVGIVGPSGAGKTTLLNIIAGLLRPDAGQILIDGEDWTGHCGRIGYMMQQDLLFEWKTVRENCRLPLTLKKVNRCEADRLVSGGLAQFGLDEAANKYPAQISGGMAKRAALLRTYLCSGDVMLLDEPFASVDMLTGMRMYSWFKQTIGKTAATAVVVTHNVAEAVFLSKRIYVLDGSPASVTQRYDVPEEIRDSLDFSIKNTAVFGGLVEEIERDCIFERV